MRVILVYPLVPEIFWSYEKILELVDRKVLLPPLGLVRRQVGNRLLSCRS